MVAPAKMAGREGEEGAGHHAPDEVTGSRPAMCTKAAYVKIALGRT
jgi:hypothetical protein